MANTLSFLLCFVLLTLSPALFINEPSKSDIKLTYFDVTGLGEPIRYLLAYGGYKFEDERLNQEQFAPRKYTFPYGKLPVLEFEGRTLHQSAAIGRYLGKKLGLVGKDEWDALECDIMVDTIVDLRASLADFAWEEHEEAKKQKQEKVMSTIVPYYMGKFEDLVAKNGGHFVKDQLTWTDFFFVGMLGYINFMADQDLLADKPALRGLRDSVLALPQLQDYIKNRPPVSF